MTTPTRSRRNGGPTEQDDAPLYRVQGLLSTYGRTLNGMLCTTHGPADDNEERLQCWVDGEPKMVAIKKVNLLRILAHEPSWETFRVCRIDRLNPKEPLFDQDQLELKLIRESDGESFDFSQLPYLDDQRLRYRPTMACLLPIENFLKDDDTTNILIKSDCLETCKLINHHSVWPENTLDDRIPLLDEASDNSRLTFFASFQRYLPHLVKPEFPLGEVRCWKRRLEAARTGLFDIYPCSHADYREFCLEVRYSSTDGFETYQEIFRSIMPHPSYCFYESSEQSTYPEIMANADPNSFWNFVLSLFGFNDSMQDEFLKSLRFPGRSISRWRGLYAGARKSKLAREAGERSLSQSRFHATSDNRRLRELPFQAIRAAWTLSVISKKSDDDDFDINRLRIPPLDSPIIGSIQRDTKHQLLPCYYDSVLEEALLCLATDGCADATSDFLFDPFENSLKLKCNCCGSRENLQECDGCGRVVYCSTDCQKERWQSHRNLCASKRVLKRREREQKDG